MSRSRAGTLLTPNATGTTAEFWLEASGPLGSVLGPILRRLIFSRNTRNATEGLKRYVERLAPPNPAADADGSEV